MYGNRGRGAPRGRGGPRGGGSRGGGGFNGGGSRGGGGFNGGGSRGGGGYGNGPRGGSAGHRGGGGGYAQGGSGYAQGGPRGGRGGGNQFGGFGGRGGNRGGGNGSIPFGKLWRYEGQIQEIPSFFIPTDKLVELRRRIISTCTQAKEVIPIAQEQARFVWMKSYRDENFGQRNCGKQAEHLRAGKGFNCGACDIFTDTHNELKTHNESTFHREILTIFRKFDALFREWHKQFEDPKYTLSESATNNMTQGLTIKKDEIKSTNSSTPLNDILFKKLDVAQYKTEDEFVLAAYDSIMEMHWAKPITDFYCRECNYKSFLSPKELEDHKGSHEHQELQKNYQSSWCISCQFNLGDPQVLENHKETGRHNMIVRLLEDVKAQAARFYRRHMTKAAAQPSQGNNIDRGVNINNTNTGNSFVKQQQAPAPLMPAGMKREASKPPSYGGSFVPSNQQHQQQGGHQTSYPQMYGYGNNAGAGGGYGSGYNQGYGGYQAF